MRYREAVHTVASHMAGLISAESLVEMCGIEEDDLSEAEVARLWKAGDEVARRLYAMGTPPAEDPEA